MLTRFATALALALTAGLSPLPAWADAPGGSTSVNVDQGAGGDGGATVDVTAGNNSTAPGASGGGSGAAQVGSKSPSKRVCTYKGDEITCTSALDGMG
jgi:hypothetical protein